MMLLYNFPFLFKVISSSFNTPTWRWWRPSATLTSPLAGWIPSKVDFIKVSCLDSVTKVTF